MGEAEHCACERWGDNSHELQREKVFAFMGGGGIGGVRSFQLSLSFKRQCVSIEC